MSVDPKHSSLHQSAQKIGIPFTKCWNPIDRHIEVNGLKLHFLEWGDPAKPTVVLLHGFAQSAHSFDFVSLSLADRFHILALDFRGHGESDWSDDEDYTREAMQKDLQDFVIKTNSAPVIIIGLSLGGTIGYKYTADNQKLVLHVYKNQGYNASVNLWKTKIILTRLRKWFRSCKLSGLTEPRISS